MGSENYQARTGVLVRPSRGFFLNMEIVFGRSERVSGPANDVLDPHFGVQVHGCSKERGAALLEALVDVSAQNMVKTFKFWR